MNGIGRAMPFTMAAFFIGSLSIIGLPPLGGMWSKWFLALGAIEAGHEIFVVVLMLSSLSSIGYLMPVVVRAFFFKPDEGEHSPNEHSSNPGGSGFWDNLQEAPKLCVIPLCATALGGIALFFFVSDLYNLLEVITVGQ